MRMRMRITRHCREVRYRKARRARQNTQGASVQKKYVSKAR